jgi:hypothetical protein
VPIRQTVNDVFALPSTGDQPLIPQHAQTLRNRRDLFAFPLGHFTDAGLALGQQRYEAQTRWVSQGPENARRPFQRRIVDGDCFGRAGVMLWAAGGIRY